MFSKLARRGKVGVVIAAIGLVGALLSGCSTAATTRDSALQKRPVIHAEVSTVSRVRVLDNVRFGTAGGLPLLLDLCLPKQSVGVVVARPAVILVHGGSWRAGNKSEWHGICEWMAENGYIGASIGYRLAPASIFPAGIHDLETAVRWLKDPVQVARYAINPKRIGAFGGSAGGNLVSLLGVSGTGSVLRGDRVAAVAELSGPIDLTAAGLEQKSFYPLELSYLGCKSYADCPQAVAASPIFHIARTDPPFFVAQSTKELIPLVQSVKFVAALRAAGVHTTFVTRPGNRHSVALLDAPILSSILKFFRATLGEPSIPVNKS